MSEEAAVVQDSSAVVWLAVTLNLASAASPYQPHLLPGRQMSPMWQVVVLVWEDMAA